MPVSYFRLLLTCSFALWNLIAHSGEDHCKYALYVPLNAIGKMNLHYVWKLFSGSQYLWYAQRDCRMNHPWAARLHSQIQEIQSRDGARELFSDIRSVTIVADSICGDIVRLQWHPWEAVCRVCHQHLALKWLVKCLLSESSNRDCSSQVKKKTHNTLCMEEINHLIYKQRKFESKLT